MPISVNTKSSFSENVFVCKKMDAAMDNVAKSFYIYGEFLDQGLRNS